MSRRRVVITGMGAVSACGEGIEPLWEAVKFGRTAIKPIQNFEHPFLRTAELPEFNPKPYVKKRKSLKIMSRDIQFSMAAASLALQDTGITSEQIDHDQFGVSLGTGIINYELNEISEGIMRGVDDQGNFSMPRFGREGIHGLFPLWSLKYVPNMPACHVSIEYGLKGPSNTITTSGAAALQAIGEARNIIERGDALYMVTGGTDSQVNPNGLSRMQTLGLLAASQQNQEGYCPFNEGQDGFVMGEGAGILIAEDLENAQKRGAKIYAEIAGYGSSIDEHIGMEQTLDSGAKVLSMQRALKDAGIKPAQLDFIVASGSGIAVQDVQEAEAIQKLFGGNYAETRVTALKPVLGHTHHAAGGLELCAAVTALNNQMIPPMAHMNQSANASLPFVAGEFLNRDAEYFLLNGFGLFGHNASIVMRRYRGGANE